MLAIVDCNSCYASCEQIFRPDLRDQPVVVLSNNDGCIITKSKQAKQLAIPDFAPYFKLKPLLKRHNVHVFSSNYELYGDISARIMSLLGTFTPRLEVYSIDEAFLDVSGVSDLSEYGRQIKRACWMQHRMPVCVGIAETKTLAKLANHIAKKSNKLMGVCVIENISAWHNVFKKLPVNKVWGVGSRLKKRLALMNIHSAYDLKIQSLKLIRKEFGVTLERTVSELNGDICIELETQPSPKKEIFCSRSFGYKIMNQTEIQESLANYAARACEKLRKQKSYTKRIYVTMATSRFTDAQYKNSLSLELEDPTNDTRIILQAVSTLARQIYRQGFQYARAGVGLFDLTDDKHTQQNFFSTGQTNKSKQTMAIIDSINARYGKGEVFFAAQGISRKWSMSREFKSPSYTTRVSDLPIVKL